MNAKVECQRGNITLAAFLSYVKRQCNKAGLSCDIDPKEFENPQHTTNSRYHVKDGKKFYTDNGFQTVLDVEDGFCCTAEVSKVMPLDFQTYVKGVDGGSYNEICEFTFDTETTGHGYYFQKTEAKNI